MAGTTSHRMSESLWSLWRGDRAIRPISSPIVAAKRLDASARFLISSGASALTAVVLGADALSAEPFRPDFGVADTLGTLAATVAPPLACLEVNSSCVPFPL